MDSVHARFPCRFLMGYTETVCMDCGFIQRECQCHVFNTLGDPVDGEDITEVVCKINEWKSTGTQTDISGKAGDPKAPKVVVNLPSGFKLNTSSEGQFMPQPQMVPQIPGSFPIIPTTLMQRPSVYNIPTMVPYSTSFNPLHQMPNTGFLGATTGTQLGPVISRPPTSVITITPTVSQMMPSNVSQDTSAGTNIKMGSNVLYVPPDVLAKSSDNQEQVGEKSDTSNTRDGLFKLDPKTGMFMSDEYSLNPKTGRVMKRLDIDTARDGSDSPPSNDLSENQPKKVQRRVLIKGSKTFIEDDEELNEEILVKRKKKKKHKNRTVKEILENKGKKQNRESSSIEKERVEGEKVSTEDNNNDKSVVTDKENDEMDKQQITGDKEVDHTNENKFDTGEENREEGTHEGNKKENVDNTSKERNESCKKEEKKGGIEDSVDKEEKGIDQIEIHAEDKSEKISEAKRTDSTIYIGPDRDTNGEEESEDSSGDSESSSEGDGETDSAEGEETKDDNEEDDVQMFDGVRYRVITPKPQVKLNTEPAQLKVKMPFAEKVESNAPLIIRPGQKYVIRDTEKPGTPGSILSKCNFSYAPSPVTGAPILQHTKKAKLAQSVDTSLDKPNASGSGKDKAGFSIFANDSKNTGKGYAKFEFAQTGEKMLRCIIYTCGQVFDTEQFAGIHQNLHQHASPKELRCKLCNFKGHVMRWYDMLRHLKETHGSVLKPKILPPKPKKKNDDKKPENDKKSDNEKEPENTKGKEENQENMSQKTDEKKMDKDKDETEDVKSISQKLGDEEQVKDSSENSSNVKSISGVTESPVKSETGANIDGASQKSPCLAITEADKSRENDSITNSTDEKAEATILKSDGLSALADVCDQLEHMDTSSSSKEGIEETSKNETTTNLSNGAEAVEDIKEIESKDISAVQTKSDAIVNEEIKNSSSESDKDITNDGKTLEKSDSPKKSDETECRTETAKGKKDDFNTEDKPQGKFSIYHYDTC